MGGAQADGHRAAGPWPLAVLLVGVLVALGACGRSDAPTVAPVETTAATVPTASSDPTAVPTDPTTSQATTGSTTTGATTTSTVARLERLAYETVADGLPFPVYVDAPDDDRRLYVVTKDGRVWVVEDDEVRPEPFLDIRDRVRDRNEQGLLGLAFAPDYGRSGRLFVHHSATDGDTILAEMRADPATAVVDPASYVVLLRVDQPAANHNGGMLTFGPDGFLYLGLGDGGGAGDRFGHGQRPDTLLGTILRLDVSTPGSYGIPPDNPFIDGGGAPEVWDYGLRNPWRFSFDPASETLWIGDVGQDRYEEIDRVPSTVGGLNLGWPIMEGAHCFRPASGCDTTGLVLPVLEVPHGDGGTCSIVGGYVYRGSAIPEIAGRYLFSDFCGGYLRSVDDTGGDPVDHTADVGRLGRVTSFGTDAAGEVYVTTADAVFRLVAVRARP